MNHPSGLVALKRAIRIVLDLKHPLIGDNIGSGPSRNEIPSLVLREGSNFLSLVRISESGTKGVRSPSCQPDLGPRAVSVWLQCGDQQVDLDDQALG